MSDFNINNTTDPFLVTPGTLLPGGVSLPPGTDTSSSNNATEEADLEDLIKNLNLLGGSINELKAKGFTQQKIESLVEGIVQGKSPKELNRNLGFSAQDIQSITTEIGTINTAKQALINDLIQKFFQDLDIDDVNNGPKIPPPNTNTTVNTVGSSATNNPYFAPSFIAVLNLVMAEVFKLQQRGHYLDEQVAIQANKTTVSIGKDMAALTLASYEAQAQEKIIEAISAFVQAAVQFVGALQSHASVGKGQRLAEQELKGHEDNLNRVRAEEGTQVGSNANEITAKSKRLQKAEDHYANQKANLSDKAFQHTRQLNESHRTVIDMTTQMVNGTASLLQAHLKELEGQLESLKQIYEAYQSVLRTYASNSQEASNSQQQEFDKSLDFLNKLTDSDFRSFSLSHGA